MASMLLITNRIREVRESRGLKQYELADRVGLSAPQMSLVETGLRLPDVEVLDTIATALETKPHRLYSREALALIAPTPTPRRKETPPKDVSHHPAYRALRRPLTAAERMEQKLRQAHRTYGLAPEAFEQMLASQGGACAICASSLGEHGERSHVDHDHRTGAVRGLLCPSCNYGLGWMRDDPDRMRRAASYLEATS